MRILKTLGVLLLGLSLLASLAGCLTGGRRGGDSATMAYDLGLPPAVAAGETAWQLEVRAPAWLDGSAMIYRLAYADAAQWREFSQARWVAPPAGLLERRLQRLLGYGAAGKRDGCLLRLELDEFSQVFTAPQHSHALLQVRARWFDAGRKPLQVKTLRIEQPVPEGRAADAQSGVAALVEAVGMLAEQIAAQEKALPAVCR